MTNSVYFDPAVGGDGSTLTDGTDANGLAGPTGRGYKTKMVPGFTNIVNIAAFVNTVAALASAAAAAATNAGNVNGTSNTNSVAIGTGSKTLVYVESNRSAKFGMWIQATDAANAANYIHGQVTDYTGNNLTINSTTTGGSGTPASWVISLSGPRGPAGTGSGDMVGQASSVDGELMLFSGTGGKTAKRGTGTGVVSVASGVVSVLTLDTDTTLAANSDTRVATQKATKAYVDAMVTGLLDFKGSTNCSGNPNYPAALKGDAYVVSAAGKIGGASGTSVDIGDVYIASADNAGGTQASVGTSWFVLEHNLAGAALLNVAQAWTARQSITPVSLTDAATVATDASLSNKFKVTLGGNRTLGNPTNTADGQSLQWRIAQDGTGSRTLAYGSKFKFPGGVAPTLSTAAGSVDYLFGEYDATSDTIVANLVKGFA